MIINMDKILLCNCCADDPYAKISNYLLENHMEEVLAGIKQKAEAVSAVEIAVLLPKKAVFRFTPDIKIYYAEESMITINSYAAAEVMKGKVPRPVISEEPALFDNKEIVMITAEVAYLLAKAENDTTKTKIMFLNDSMKTDVVEVPLKSKLIEVIQGREVSMNHVKGILLGGIRGRFIAEDDLTDYEVAGDNLYDSITFYNQDACMVEEIKQLSQLIQSTSCGKCVLCREGSLQYMTIIEDMTAGKSKIADLELLKEISGLIKIGAYCDFGQAMPNLFTTGFDLFQEEFDIHIKKKSCPSGVCQAFASYCILPKQCTGCEECIDSCPEEAIEGKKGFIHMINEDLCEKCGKCVEACEEQAIIRIVGMKPKLPQKLTKVGKF
ncbi:MAG: NADH-ubiquinone oxidoreductase-F iron-sulfur binding region domain-containing protein [Mobilitalea sp.]